MSEKNRSLMPRDINHALVVRLALPMAVAHLSTPLLGFADAAVIGRLGEAYLLGAIAAAAVVFDFTFWGFGFLRMGTASLTAQSLGRDDAMEGRAVLLRAMIMAGVLGVVLIALQRPIAWIGFTLLDASGPVTGAARSYFDIRIWSAPFALANYALLGVFIGRGKTGIALGLQILINVSNIIFNVSLVYGLSLGVRGSALGTFLAEILGVIGGLVTLTALDRQWFVVDRKILKDRTQIFKLMSINRDLVIRTLALSSSYAFFTAQGARGGDVILAANAVLMNLYLISACFLDGFATAAQQLCGQAYGAGDGVRFRAAVRLTMIWCLTFAACLSLIAYIGGHAFVTFVSTSDAVREAAWCYIPYAAAAAFCGAAAFEFDGVFFGATWTREMRNMMLFSMVLYLLSFLALLPFGNTGLWLAFLFFLSVRGVTQYWLYRGLVRETFPLAQSAAPVPVASASRG